jgi:3-hydroxyisobutyrate dehydrogenase-like beta-hydroxyacid dehydrogenase
VTLLDAPVSGGVAGARKGTLAVMVGGDESTVEACRPLFEVIGQRIFYLGPSGAGSVAKLVNNLLFFHGLMGSLEALVLAGKAGVDLTILRDVVQASSGGSFVWDFASRAILKDRLAPNFSVTLAAKDADLALGLAEQLGVPTPIGTHVGAELRRYRDGGYATDDVLTIVKALEAAAGVTVRGAGLS